MITALVGAQFGSEGKGLIAGHLAKREDIREIHVRVGAANAGHTVYAYGEKHVVQQIPCAAYANPWARLVLGAGALISPEIFLAELRTLREWRAAQAQPPPLIYIDQRAHAVTDQHKIAEQLSGLQERIGSTSATAREGIGAAQAMRVMRTDYALAIDELPKLLDYREQHLISWCNSIKLLHDAATFGTDILLEGTQGTGLSNTTGFYPYVTSRDTTAAALAAQVGFGPRDINRVVLVARTFPIRVAGNSGPFWPDSAETDWETLGVDAQKEKTTVTKKIRRVATFSYAQIREAVKLNSATDIALTFADYLAPELAGQKGPVAAAATDSYDHVGPMVRKIEDQTGVPVTMIGTGPDSVIDRSPGV